MKILVSACLLGKNCKYSGGNNYRKELIKILEGHDLIPICPEVMGGLPTPRLPSEIKDGIVINSEGRSTDHEYRLGAAIALETARKRGAEIAILKSRSPSCGVGEIYDGTFTGKLIRGMGITAALLSENRIPVFSDEDPALFHFLTGKKREGQK